MDNKLIENEDEIQKLDEELSDLESTEISGGINDDDTNYIQCKCQNYKCGT